MGARASQLARLSRSRARDGASAAAFTALCLLGLALHPPLPPSGGDPLVVLWPAAGTAVLWVARQRERSARLRVLVAVGVLAAGAAALTGAAGWSAVLVGAAEAAGAAAAVVAVEALQRGRLRLARGVDVWPLAAASAVGGTTASLVRAPALLLGGSPDVLSGALVHLVGSSTGTFLVVAVVLRLRQTAGTSLPRHPHAVAGSWERTGIWAIGLATFATLFLVLDGVPGTFLAFPVAVWAALRLRPRALAVLLLTASVITLVGTVLGRGPFGTLPLEAAVPAAHVFVGVLTVIVLSISLHRDERDALTAGLDAALAEARDRSALLSAVHQAVPHGIIVYSAAGASLLRNPAAEDLLGPNPRQGEPRSWEGAYTFTRPDGSAPETASLPVVRALAGEDVTGDELVVRGPAHPEGRLLTSDAHPLPEVEGAPWSRGAVAVFHDITAERARSTDASRTRDLLAGVLHGATELGIFALDLDHRITVFSSGAERLLGWTAAEVVGERPIVFLKLSELHERAAALGVPPGPHVVLRGLAEHGTTTDRWTYVRRDGSTFTAEITHTQMHDDDGGVIGTIAVLTDVTAKIAAEQRLADSEEQFRLAFETAPTGMVVLSLEEGRAGRIDRANDAFAAFSGRPRAALLAQRVRDLLHPDEVAGHVERLERIFDGHRPPRGGLEQRFLTPEGQLRWGRTSSSLIQPSDGSAPHLLVVVEDVTESHAEQVALQHAALHDPLTGLPNRALLADRLQQALSVDERERLGVSVVFLDLDGFKPVNDTHGHAAGDALLREVAGRLSAEVRARDTVARLGGDEFAVVCPGLPADEVAALADRLRAAVAKSVRLPGGARVRVSASLGTATAVGGDDAERLLDEADRRMYDVKRARSGARGQAGPPAHR